MKSSLKLSAKIIMSLCLVVLALCMAAIYDNERFQQVQASQSQKVNSTTSKSTYVNNYSYSESKSTPKTTTSSNKCSHSACATNGPFYCMGKNDTCNNKTSCAYIMYCSACK